VASDEEGTEHHAGGQRHQRRRGDRQEEVDTREPALEEGVGEDLGGLPELPLARGPAWVVDSGVDYRAAGAAGSP